MYLLGVGILLFLSLLIKTCRTPPASSQLQARIDSVKQAMVGIKRDRIKLIMNRLHQRKQFNGNVLVAYEGKLLLNESYGFADFDQEIPLNSNSLFRIGSLSKQFTAYCALRLAELKKFSLGDPVSRYITNWPYPEVKIYHLLSHTSGLPDYLNYFYAQNTEMLTYARNQNVISWLQQDSTLILFEPGSRWAYSASDYTILAYLMEVITQEPIDSLMKTHIWGPLEMKSTFLPGHRGQIDQKELARAYRPGHQTHFEDNFLNHTYGEFGVYANIDDLYRWDQALHSSKVLSETVVKQLFSPVELSDSTKLPKGLGWYIKESEPAYYQMGAWLGYRSAFLSQPSKKITILLLSNDVNPFMESLMTMIQDILNDRNFKIPR